MLKDDGVIAACSARRESGMAKPDPNRMWKISAGLDSTSGLAWINRPVPDTQVLPPGPFHGRGNRNVWGSGFPEMDTPVFVFDRKLGRAPTDAEEPMAYRWLLSEPAKLLLEKLDATAFHFVRVRTVLRDRSGECEGPPYWLADVVRFLDAFDMESGAFAVLDDGRQMPRGLDIERFKSNVVDGHLIFRPIFWQGSVYCKNELKRAVKAAGLKGFEFSGGGHFNV
jgi:hypothetical protein